MDRPGCSPLIFGRNSEQNKKKAELKRKKRENIILFLDLRDKSFVTLAAFSYECFGKAPTSETNINDNGKHQN